MNKKKIKTIVAVVLIVVGILWLIPTIFVTTVQMRVTDAVVADETNVKYTGFTVTYTYQKNGQSKTGQYSVTLLKGEEPLIGEQGVCHYYNFPPYSVHLGTPKSPVPPLVTILLGIALLWIRSFKFYRKKKNDEQ